MEPREFLEYLQQKRAKLPPFEKMTLYQRKLDAALFGAIVQCHIVISREAELEDHQFQKDKIA